MFGLCKLTSYSLYQPLASVSGRRDSLSVYTLAPYVGSLFLITSESTGELDCSAHDAVVGIRTRLQEPDLSRFRLACGVTTAW